MFPPGLDECAGIGAGLGLGAVDWDGDGSLDRRDLRAADRQRLREYQRRFQRRRRERHSRPGEASSSERSAAYEDWNSLLYDFRSHPRLPDGGDTRRERARSGDDPAGAHDIRPAGTARADVDATGPAGATPGGTVDYGAKVTNTGRGPSWPPR